MQSINKCMKLSINIVFLLIIMILACGCQPSPERTAVVYGGGMEEKLKGTPVPFGAYDAPASWQETLDMKGSDTIVEINASISVPDVTAFPVYKVKQTNFDETCIGSLVDYFAKGKDVYKDTEPTKAELEGRLIKLKENLAKEKADPSSNESDIEYLEDAIDLIEAELPDAPESVEPEAITDWSPEQSPSGSFLTEDGEYAGIFVSLNKFGYGNGFIETESMLAMNGKDNIGEIVISKEDAVAAAQNMLRELGVDYMAACSLEKAQLYPVVENMFAEEPSSKGYLIKFARNIDGIAGITNESTPLHIMDDFDYMAPLYPEEIETYINEAGKLQSFVWSHPLVIEEKVTENADLLPFKDIKQRIRDMFTFINSYNSKPIKVISIEMNMTIVGVKDYPGEAMYVPAWFIYYTKTFKDPDTGEDMQQEYKLVLNAIDGGRVLEVPINVNPEIQ